MHMDYCKIGYSKILSERRTCFNRSMINDMNVIIDTDENTVIARINGEVDHHNAKSIRDDIDLAIDRHHTDRLILDFDGVTFMDSSGIGLVIGRYNSIKPYGGTIVIENTGNQIKKVMRLAGLDRLAVIK